MPIKAFHAQKNGTPGYSATFNVFLDVAFKKEELLCVKSVAVPEQKVPFLL